MSHLHWHGGGAVNTEASTRSARNAMNECLAEISTRVAPGAHARLICDDAGWHQAGERLIVPDNITLMRLPPYAPELNLMENAWDDLRSNTLSSLVWDSYDAIVKACKQAWQFLIDHPERIASIEDSPWTFEPQKLADQTGLILQVCPYPPGTSQWNKNRASHVLPHHSA